MFWWRMVDGVFGEKYCNNPSERRVARIPGKNILDFNGRPMIALTIDAALNSGIFYKVLVSTDCEEIAAVSRSLRKVCFMTRKR